MTRAGVTEDVIVTHVQSHGMVAPLQAADLIVLQQQGVSPRVVRRMQAPPPMAAPAAYGAAGRDRRTAVSCPCRFITPAAVLLPPLSTARRFLGRGLRRPW